MQVEIRGVTVQLFGVEAYETEVLVLGYHAPEDTRGAVSIAGREYEAVLVGGLRVCGLPAPLDLEAPLVWEAK